MQCHQINLCNVKLSRRKPPLKSTFALTSKKTYYRVRVEDTPSLRARNSYLTSKASGTEFQKFGGLFNKDTLE